MNRSLYLGILTLVGVVATAATFEARQERSSLMVYATTL